MRITVVVLGVQPDALHQSLDLGLDALGRLDLLDLERCADDGADRVTRIERAVRILKHHLHLGPKLAQFVALDPGDVTAPVHDRASGRRHQLQDGASGC